MSIIFLVIALCVVSITSGRLHSHHSDREIDDTDLEKALNEKYYQDEDEAAFDEYSNRHYEPELDETDELLADPRPYARPRRWRWLGTVSISCTLRCGSYNWCILRNRDHRRCRRPSGCICNRFAWEGK